MSSDSPGSSPASTLHYFYNCYNIAMETEYEAKFLDVDKTQVRARLKSVGATLERTEFLQRRWVLDLPQDLHSSKVFARVRDEGGIVTLTYKEFSGEEKDNPQEIEVIVNDFEDTVELLTKLGCKKASYQENYRELWHLGEAEITIDSWPFFNPFVEIEGTSEEVVEAASKKAGFDWSAALFCGVSRLYRMRYGENVHIREMPMLTFAMPNPFA